MAKKPRKKGSQRTREATHVDEHVGSQIKARRILLGLSQEKLADALGIAFQQVQKYETGANRVSASRLYNIAQLLELPITYFFEGLDEGSDRGVLAAAEGLPGDILNRKESLTLLRYFYAIEDEGLRDKVRDFLKSLSLD